MLSEKQGRERFEKQQTYTYLRVITALFGLHQFCALMIDLGNL